MAGIDESVLEALRKHLFNGIIWPDFGTLPDAEASVIRWCPLESGLPHKICGYEVTAVRVNHSVPAVGYRIRSNDSALLYTGDTGPTEIIWGIARGLTALIVEVSFPSRLQTVADLSLHLTPTTLAIELGKLKRDVPIYLYHLKPSCLNELRAELAATKLPHPVEELVQDAVYQF